MCLNPVHIRLKPSLSQFYRSADYWKNPVVRDMYNNGVDVSCRNCLECQKQKQSDYTQYVTEICKSIGNVVFLTLTYAPENLPVCKCREVSYSFAEYKFISHCVTDIDPAFFNGKNRPFPAADGTFRMASLRRKDVSKIIKQSRTDYFRTFKKVSPVKFFCVGEYGTKSGRPHYHILLLNCDTDFYSIFVKRWKTTFGFARLSKRAIKNKSIYVVGGAESVAHYLAKYLCKGSFDFRYLSAVEKPRVICSLNLFDYSEEQKEKFLALDWIKSNNLPLDFTLWTSEEQNVWYDIVSHRMQINGFNFGSHLRSKVFRQSAYIVAPVVEKYRLKLKFKLYNHGISIRKLQSEIKSKGICKARELLFTEKEIELPFTFYSEKSKMVYFSHTLSLLYASIARMRLDNLLLSEYRQTQSKPLSTNDLYFNIEFESFKKDKKADSSKVVYKKLVEFYSKTSAQSRI